MGEKNSGGKNFGTGKGPKKKAHPAAPGWSKRAASKKGGGKIKGVVREGENW